MNPSSPSMNPFLFAAAGILVALVPCLIVCARGDLPNRVVGLSLAGTLTTLELLMLSEGFSRPSFFDLPLTLALLTVASGLVFGRFVQRWF